MPELKTSNGEPVLAPPIDEDAVNRAFSQSINEDAGPDESAPPRRAEKPAEDKPRAARPRTTKAEKARTTAKPADPVKDDYHEDARALITTTWTAAASLGPTQPYAFALSQSADPLTDALADGAKHNDFIRRMVSGGGGNAWQLKLAAAGMQFGMTTLAIMRDPEMKKQAAEATRAQLAAAMQAQGIKVPGTDQAPVPAAA
jgi:hypothetical protein